MEVKLLLDTSAYSGFHRGAKFEQNMRMLRRFLEHEAVEIAPVGEVTADRYSRIVMQLKKDGSPIPINDVWIAAQAMEHGAELLASDRHFEQVAGPSVIRYNLLYTPVTTGVGP